MGGNALDEGPSTSKEGYKCDMLIIQDLIEDVVNRVTGIVDYSFELMDVGSPELTQEVENHNFKENAPQSALTRQGKEKVYLT